MDKQNINSKINDNPDKHKECECEKCNSFKNNLSHIIMLINMFGDNLIDLEKRNEDFIVFLKKKDPHKLYFDFAQYENDIKMITLQLKELKSSVLIIGNSEFIDLYQDTMEKFILNVKKYNNISDTYRNNLIKIIKSQIKLVNPNVNIDDIKIDDPFNFDYNKIFLIKNDTKKRNTYEYIESRHNRILKLEKSLNEVQTLFLITNALIIEHDEKINAIKLNIHDTKNTMDDAQNILKKTYNEKKNIKTKCSLL